MNKILMILLIVIIPFKVSLAAGEATAGIAAAGVAMAMAQSEQNKEDAIKARNVQLIPPPIDWAIKKSCKLQATENIGEYKCYTKQGLNDEFYLITVNSKGKVVNAYLTNNSTEVTFWAIVISIILGGIGGFLIYKTIT